MWKQTHNKPLLVLYIYYMETQSIPQKIKSVVIVVEGLADPLLDLLDFSSALQLRIQLLKFIQKIHFKFVQWLGLSYSDSGLILHVPSQHFFFEGSI